MEKMIGFIGIITGLLAVAGAYYVYTILKRLKIEFISDISTIKKSLEDYVDNIRAELNTIHKTAVDANAGAIKLAKVVLENNLLAVQTLKANKNMKGKEEFYPALHKLEQMITARGIGITNATATASGFKVDIPFGQFSFSFSSNTVKAYKEGAKQFDLKEVKRLLPKK